jgi:hypothetical protein
MKIRIKEQSWLARLAAWKLGTPAMAITLGRTIHLHNTLRADFLADQSWVCHELAHVRQFERYGFLPFLFRYLWESLRKGYYNNRWEAEARQSESDKTVLRDIDFY